MLEFFEFLNRRGVLFAWSINNDLPSHYNPEPHLFIGGAFDWKSSPQGHDFWQLLSKGWDDELLLMR